MDRFRAANTRLEDILARQGSREQGAARLVAVAIIVVLSGMFALAGYLILVRPARREAARRAEEDAYKRTRTEFTDALQLTRSEAEAQDLLRHHVQQTVPDSTVVVLEHEVCDDHVAAGTEFPLLVGGEAIGSVLVEHDGRLGAEQAGRLADAIRQAAPVLANLRNLAIAETRAATDALTGLPNRRALEDTMRRMLAQADRTGAPLSVLAIDLDHFKRVNDTHGHEHGDAVLAGVGHVLGAAIRASDFVARYGGEELVVLAPDTDAAGALLVAEKLRRAIATIDLPADDGSLTASFGVAAFPEHGADAETLMRAADRALYDAKQRGRDRVELAPAGQGLVEPVSS
jgi:diguanylate cyclase (GGDEF)-like protein